MQDSSGKIIEKAQSFVTGMHAGDKMFVPNCEEDLTEYGLSIVKLQMAEYIDNLDRSEKLAIHLLHPAFGYLHQYSDGDPKKAIELINSFVDFLQNQFSFEEKFDKPESKVVGDMLMLLNALKKSLSAWSSEIKFDPQFLALKY